MRTICLVDNILVDRRLQKFSSDKYFWLGKLLLKTSYRWNGKHSKKENSSKKNNNTHRNKNKKLNTTNVVSSIFFYHRQNSLLLISVPNKNLLKARAFLNNAILLGIHLLETIISHIR